MVNLELAGLRLAEADSQKRRGVISLSVEDDRLTSVTTTVPGMPLEAASFKRIGRDSLTLWAVREGYSRPYPDLVRIPPLTVAQEVQAAPPQRQADRGGGQGERNVLVR